LLNFAKKKIYMKAYVLCPNEERVEIPIEIALGLSTGDFLMVDCEDEKNAEVEVRYKWYSQASDYGEPYIELDCTWRD